MAIGGVGAYGINRGYYEYQSTVNELRLSHKLQNISGKYKVDNVKPVNSLLKENSSNFLQSYNSTFSDLMQSSNALKESNSSGVWNQLSVTSSESAVADASANYKITEPVNFEMEISQAAAAQTNVSDSLKAGQPASSDMSIYISANQGAAAITVNSVRENGSTKTNRQMVQEMVKAINKENLGVTASINENDGKVALQIKSNYTGSDYGFSVDQKSANASGLEVVKQAAQDARYVITDQSGSKKEYTSDSNKVSLEHGKVNVNIRGSGKTTVSAEPNEEGIVSSVAKFITSYNNTINMLDKNADRGSGVENQIKNMSNAPAAEESMELVGIGVNKDGTLSLNKDVLRSSIKKDPQLVKEIIGGSDGVAQSGFNDAVSGLNARSDSLINNDIAKAQSETVHNPVNFMNLYTKTGAYNSNNYYALGLMMNYLA